MAGFIMGCNWFLNHARWVVEVEKPSTVPDGYGGQANTYTKLGNYFCVLQPLAGRDEFDFEASEPKVRHKATLRWVEELSNTAQVQKFKFTIDDREFRPIYCKNLDQSRKFYGHHYIEIALEDNGAINAE